ncbi:MAG TPA: PmoA family protein [Bryobacteraceae bacterium]|nr:PmoA family protein [Bryobacteraceae bacterium]
MKSASCFLLAAALPLCAQVKITQRTDRISVEIDGKPFTELFIGADTSKPYLHPLRAASGKIVTRAYPMDTVEGESKDHPHHRGLWFTHGDVNGYDFWGNEASQKGAGAGKGKVVLKKVGELKSGKKSGSLAATFDWVDPQGKPILTESRTIVFYSHPTMRIMDFDINLKALEKVKFGDTKEGTFAIRLAAGLEEPVKKSLPTPKRTGLMVNAEGAKGEKNVWGKRSPWVDYAGELEGEKLGIAIFDNPANPKHPTYWHSRSYGLFAANIFGEHDYYNDKSRDGSVTVEAGNSLRFRYRVIIHPGDAASAGIAELYKKYKEAK